MTYECGLGWEDIFMLNLELRPRPKSCPYDRKEHGCGDCMQNIRTLHSPISSEELEALKQSVEALDFKENGSYEKLADILEILEKSYSQPCC